MKTDIQIKFIGKKPSFRGYTLVDGVPGFGLVGTVAANFLIEKLNMELVGYVESPHFPPVAAIHKGEPLPPFRIYISRKNKLMVIVCEFILSTRVIFPLTQLIYDFAKKEGMVRIVSLGGISIHGKQDEVFSIASHEEDRKRLESMEIQFIKEGATTGMNAMLLILGKVDGSIPVVSLLGESRSDIVDPFGAALVLTALSEFLGIKVDTSELVKEAIVIQNKLKEAMKIAKEADRRFKRPEYESMYG